VSTQLADWLAACPVVEEPASSVLPTFAGHLRRYRERAQLSCNELARAVGIDPSYVSRLERLERVPPRRTVVVALCAALHLSDEDQDTLLASAGYAPPWLGSVADLGRLRQIAQHLDALAGLLTRMGVEPEREAYHAGQ
jgi:transcriptional regulator with XRE-family HTH domain